MSGWSPVLPQYPPISRSQVPQFTIILLTSVNLVSPFLHDLLDKISERGDEETCVTLLLPDVKYEELQYLLQCIVGVESYQSEKLLGLVQLLGIETKVQSPSSPSEKSVKLESHLEEGDGSYEDFKQDLILNDDEEIYLDDKESSENIEEIDTNEGSRTRNLLKHLITHDESRKTAERFIKI